MWAQNIEVWTFDGKDQPYVLKPIADVDPVKDFLSQKMRQTGTGSLLLWNDVYTAYKARSDASKKTVPKDAPKMSAQNIKDKRVLRISRINLLSWDVYININE